MSTPFKVVIPSRYAASRLPGKALRSIAGKSMVARVLDRAMASGADEVIVATDDERILAEVEKQGGRAMMTKASHLCGTDRLAEVVSRLSWDDSTIVVNVQGDEPCIPVQLIQGVAAALANHPTAGIATMATPIKDAAEFFNHHAVKVVCSEPGMALYFSRAPIPWVRDVFRPGQVEPVLPDVGQFLRHIGMYAYRAGVLKRLAAHAQSCHEKAESLEQLRALDMGIGIHVTVIDGAPPAGVDTEEDLARVEAVIARGLEA